MANKKFGNKLRLLRNAKGYTQQQVADILKLKNKSTLASWEIGKSEPDGYTFLNLCRIYDVKDVLATFNEDYIDNPEEDISQKEKKILYMYKALDNKKKAVIEEILQLQYNTIKGNDNIVLEDESGISTAKETNPNLVDISFLPPQIQKNLLEVAKTNVDYNDLNTTINVDTAKQTATTG